MGHEWTVHNPEGKRRVVVTKQLPGSRWLDILVAADCAVEVCESPDVLTNDEIIEHFGDRCDGAIGQLTENWNADLFAKTNGGDLGLDVEIKVSGTVKEDEIDGVIGQGGPRLSLTTSGGDIDIIQVE